MNFNWIKSTALNEFSAHINLNDGLLLKNTFKNIENILTQNLVSSVNYSKNWKTSSASAGYKRERNLSIEKKYPIIVVENSLNVELKN